jgi:hypothetical protein
MSIAQLTGQPKKLTAGGKDYLIYPLTLDDLGKLQSWIDGHFPDPFAVIGKAIERGAYTVPQQQYLMQQALSLSVRPQRLIGTPEADSLLQSVDGIKQLLLLSIRKGRPEFSEADAAELFAAMGLGDIQAAFAVTGVGMVMSDPKGSRKTSSSTGISESRRPRKKVLTGGSSTTKR